MNIKARLRKCGKSLHAWALEQGYLPSTVYSVVRRWEHRTDRKPHGGIGRHIMADLRRELDEE